MKLYRRRILRLAPAVLSWLLVVASPLIVPFFGQWVAMEPLVPRVSMPNFERDLVSSVGGLALVCMLALISAGIVEIGKVLAVRDSKRPVSSYVLLVIFQLSATLDLLSMHAGDWLVWLGTWVGAQNGARWHPEVEPNMVFPVFSTVILSIVILQSIMTPLSSDLEEIKPPS